MRAPFTCSETNRSDGAAAAACVVLVTVVVFVVVFVVVTTVVVVEPTTTPDALEATIVVPADVRAATSARSRCPTSPERMP